MTASVYFRDLWLCVTAYFSQDCSTQFIIFQYVFDRQVFCIHFDLIEPHDKLFLN